MKKNPGREQLQKLYVEQGQTQQEIADLHGVTKVSVGRWLIEEGIRPRHPGRQRGPENPSWKGGLTMDKDGYVLRYTPNHPYANRGGYVREHRLVMEKMIGRHLRPEEVVHHKDDCTSNNHPSNLQLFENNGAHLSETRKGMPSNWTEEGLARMKEAADRQRTPLPDNLLEMYETMTAQQIADQLGCGTWAIYQYLHAHGAQLRPAHTREKELSGDDLLELRKRFRSNKEMASFLDTSEKTLRRRLKRLGYSAIDEVRVVWPSDDVLREMYQTRSRSQMAKELGCSSTAVQHKLNSIGIEWRAATFEKKWDWPTDDEMRQLVEKYPKLADLSRHLNVEYDALRSHLNQHGLRQPSRKMVAVKYPPDAELLKMYETMTATEIGLILSCDCVTVLNKLRKIGATIRPAQPRTKASP